MVLRIGARMPVAGRRSLSETMIGSVLSDTYGLLANW